MDIDSSDDEDPAHRHDLKRTWQRFLQDTDDDASLPSTPPEFKRQRTEAPPSPPPPPPLVTELFSWQQHGALIALIQGHGGKVVASDGDTVQLTLPPATDLDFQVHYFRQRLALLRQGVAFPGVEDFAQTLADTFADLLHTATLANQASLLHWLLPTGLANQSGTLLRELAQQARAAGSMAAVDAITNTCAYWVDGLDPYTLGNPAESSIRTGDSDQPPPNWQAGIRRDLTHEQAKALQVALRDGDTSVALDLLFIPEHRPASGQFSVRIFDNECRNLLKLLQSNGVVAIETEADENTMDVVVYSTDLDRAALQSQLSRQLQQRALGNAETSDDNPLALAAEWGDPEVFQTLWSQANERQRRTFSREALHCAAKAGATPIAIALLPYVDNPANDSLYFAAQHGRTATCAALLDAGMDPQSQLPALVAAARHGHTTTCALLISRGVAVNVNDDDDGFSENPLLIAAAQGHQKICQLLVMAGAWLGQLHSADVSVLSYAAESGNISFYQYLLDFGAGQQVPAHHSPPLAHAARGNHVAMLDYLLKSGEDIERTDWVGHTPLLAACQFRAYDSVVFLLARNANIDPNNSSTFNAITCAVAGGSRPILQALLHANLPRVYWMQALLKAVNVSADIVRELLPLSRLDPRAVGLAADHNPLLRIDYSSHWSDDFEERHKALSLLLREPSLPLHHVTDKGNDALMMAVEGQDATAVEMLLSAGLRIGQQNHKRQHALHLAVGQIEIADDSDNHSSADEGAVIRSRILHALGKSLRQQPDQRHLARDVWFSQTDPLKRDLALFLVYANSESTVDLPAMMGAEHSEMPELWRALLMPPANASTNALTQTLVLTGVPSPVHARLLPLLSALPPIRERLFRQGVPAERTFEAAVNGLYLTLETDLDEIATAAHYASLGLDNDWKTTLTSMTRQWLTRRIDLAAERQRDDIAPVFGDLFARCADSTVAKGDYRSAMMQPPTPGIVAARLNEAGVYASLADEIGTAWLQAWQQVSNSLTATDLRSNNDLGNALLAAFREALGARVGAPSSAGHLINRIDAPADAARVYTDLMFQQLHMLEQFINPEAT